MNFFGMGTGEILLILIVALIVLGPGRVPEIARTLGRMVHTLRKASLALTAEVSKEIEEVEKDRPVQLRKYSGDKTKKSSDMDGATLPHRGD